MNNTTEYYESRCLSKLLQFANAVGVCVSIVAFKSDAKGLMKQCADKTFKVGIREGLSIEDAAYTLVHELAHIYLHADKGDTINSHLHNEYEEQADRAATMLLDFVRMGCLHESRCRKNKSSQNPARYTGSNNN